MEIEDLEWDIPDETITDFPVDVLSSALPGIEVDEEDILMELINRRGNEDGDINHDY